MTSRTPLTAQFFDQKGALLEAVGAFLREGLIAGQPAIVIATEAHREAIVTYLTAQDIDVDGARRMGDLVLLDADETLALFMVDSIPNAELFKHQVATLLGQNTRGSRLPTRAYTNMMDVLWARGRHEAAVRVEVLWGELSTTGAFSVQCVYSMGNFYKQSVAPTRA